MIIGVEHSLEGKKKIIMGSQKCRSGVNVFVWVCVNANARAAPASGADACVRCVFVCNVRSTGGIDGGIDTYIDR